MRLALPWPPPPPPTLTSPEAFGSANSAPGGDPAVVGSSAGESPSGGSASSALVLEPGESSERAVGWMRRSGRSAARARCNAQRSAAHHACRSQRHSAEATLRQIAAQAHVRAGSAAKQAPYLARWMAAASQRTASAVTHRPGSLWQGNFQVIAAHSGLPYAHSLPPQEAGMRMRYDVGAQEACLCWRSLRPAQ